MRKLTTSLLIIFLMTFLLACSNLNDFIPPDADGILIFEDTFDGNTFDTTKWKFITHNEYKRRGAYYDTDNIIVKDGTLTIRTNYRDGKHGKGWYTAWLETSINKHQQDSTDDYLGFNATYGYFEIRCKIDYVVGAWAAFWMMPDEGVAFTDEDIQHTGTDGAELDIMETNWMRGYTGHVVHYDGYDARLKSVNSGAKAVKNLHTRFNTYALEWTPEWYIFYINGKETWRTNQMGVSNVLQYMIISGEVGGYHDGDTMYPGLERDGSYHWTGNVNTKSQQKRNYDFVIDHVRVYKTNPYV